MAQNALAIIVVKTSVLVDDIISRSVEVIRNGGEVSGIGAMMGNDNQITQLHYKDVPMTAEMYKRLFVALKELVSIGKAICSAIIQEGQMELGEGKFDAMIINLFHKDLQKHEFITYIVPYVVMKSSSGNNEVVVMQDSADVEINAL